MRGRDQIKKYVWIINILIGVTSIFNKHTLFFLFKSCSNIGGKKGLLIRYIMLKKLAYKCGDNVSIHKGSLLFNIDRMSFGSNVSIHPFCYIDATGGIEIGDNTSIAHGVSIMSTSHSYQNKEIFIKDQPVIVKRTIIGSDVWIGAKVMILAGITVEDRSIIGASSVVTKNVQSNTIVVGNPAKVIKNILI